MNAVIFFMEDAKKSMFSPIELWRRMIFAFKIDCYIVVDETENNEFVNWSDQHKESHVVKTLEEALEIHPELERVWITKDGAENLKGFNHSKDNSLYIFGSDGHSIEVNNSKKVKINIDTELWSIQAASMVLYDRSTKV